VDLEILDGILQQTCPLIHFLNLRKRWENSMRVYIYKFVKGTVKKKSRKGNKKEGKYERISNV
jgi:hypothetical protein